MSGNSFPGVTPAPVDDAPPKKRAAAATAAATEGPAAFPAEIGTKDGDWTCMLPDPKLGGTQPCVQIPSGGHPLRRPQEPAEPRPRPRAARSAARASVRRGRGSKARRAAAAGAARSRPFRPNAALLRRNRAWKHPRHYSPKAAGAAAGNAEAADSGRPDPQPIETTQGEETWTESLLAWKTCLWNR